jgi:hypothetical protein
MITLLDTFGPAVLRASWQAAVLALQCGFRETLDGAQQELPPGEKLHVGQQEARIIATRLGSPPPGYANWTLRLAARKVVKLGIVESVRYGTVRRTLKRTA